MPVLKQLRSKTEYKLPESGGTVEMYSEFLTGDYRQLMEGETISAETKEVPADKGIQFVTRLIHGWDFTDEKGVVLPVNAENIDLLPIGDLNILAEHVGKVAENSAINPDLKKNTPGSST